MGSGPTKKKLEGRPRRETSVWIELGPQGELVATRGSEDCAPGEPSGRLLTDPDRIRASVESPVAYARYVMVLAEAFRRCTGATRSEAVDYLVTMFLAPTDLAFGYEALLTFGPATGIIDIYPLEVLARMMVRYPGLLPGFGFGTIFESVDADNGPLRTDTATAVYLSHLPKLRIGGFAVRGGGRSGYIFRPARRKSTYEMWFHTPGRYELLVSAQNAQGNRVVQHLDLLVRPAAGEVAPPEIEDDHPARSPSLVAGWPAPEAPVLTHSALKNATSNVIPSSAFDRGITAGDHDWPQPPLLELSESKMRRLRTLTPSRPESLLEHSFSFGSIRIRSSMDDEDTAEDTVLGMDDKTLN